MEIQDEADEMLVHYYGTYDLKKPIGKQRFHLAWIDPADDKEVYSSRPRKTWQAFTRDLPTSSVIFGGFTLQRGFLPEESVRQIRAILRRD